MWLSPPLPGTALQHLNNYTGICLSRSSCLSNSQCTESRDATTGTLVTGTKGQRGTGPGAAPVYTFPSQTRAVLH